MTSPSSDGSLYKLVAENEGELIFEKIDAPGSFEGRTMTPISEKNKLRNGIRAAATALLVLAVSLAIFVPVLIPLSAALGGVGALLLVCTFIPKKTGKMKAITNLINNILNPSAGI